MAVLSSIQVELAHRFLSGLRRALFRNCARLANTESTTPNKMGNTPLKFALMMACGSASWGR